MKRITLILIITTFQLCHVAKAQEDPDDIDVDVAIEAPDTDPYIDWCDPRYNGFFTSSSGLKSGSNIIKLKSGITFINH
jgi:hypothetical protein